jgi:aryl-alcohol dehydrogenase-like predicted oxidoreductase
MRVRSRTLGKTGLVVSELALGTWGLSGEPYGQVDEKVAEKAVSRALEMGFTLFDTSDAYGGGRMEALLGKLAGDRNVTLVTRGGTDRATTPARKRFDGEYLRGAIERSRKRLRRDRIDLYLLHNPSVETLVGGEAVDTLSALKEEGKIAHWGVSVGDVEVARSAIQVEAEVIQLAYNLLQAIDLHRLAGDIMVAGTGVLAHSILAYGLLAGMWTKDREFAEGDHRNQRWTKVDLARRVGQLDAVRYLVRGDVLTMRGAAVRFVLANNLVTAAVLGPRSVEQLEQLVRETGSGPTYLPDDQLSGLARALTRVGIPT